MGSYDQVQGRAELEAIIELIFKKAVTEPHYSHWEHIFAVLGSLEKYDGDSQNDLFCGMLDRGKYMI